MLKTTIAAAAVAGILLLSPGGRRARVTPPPPTIPDEQLVPFPQLEDPTGPPAARDLVKDELAQPAASDSPPRRLFHRLRGRRQDDHSATGARRFGSRLRERFQTWRASRSQRRADRADSRQPRKHRFRRGIVPSSNDRPTGRTKQHGRESSPWEATKTSDPHAGLAWSPGFDALRTGRCSDARRPGCKLRCAPARLQAG